jgi:hypothetical protein
MTNLPPPIPYRSPEQFRPTGEPWSSLPVLIAVTLLSVFITLLSALVSLHFEHVFRDFKVDLPTITQWAIWIAGLIWNGFVWIPLILTAVLAPLLVIPRLPAPADDAARRRIVRFTRLIMTVAYLVVAAFTVFSMFAPMIALINSTAGPSGGEAVTAPVDTPNSLASSPRQR